VWYNYRNVLNAGKKEMNVIILNGPMGVGKTTVGTRIAEKVPGTALIDGDWCMDIHPFVGNRETKEMAIDNILHMIGNYQKCSVCEMVVLVWLMDEAWVHERLAEGIQALGLGACEYTLICSEEQLRRQWAEDTTCPWRTEEWLRISVKSLQHFSSLDNCLDTTGLSAEAVADRIIEEVTSKQN